MNTVSKFYFRSWRMAVLVLSVALIAYLLYFRRLGTLLPGYSASELKAYTNAVSWHAIATNPINAPYKIVVWLLTAIFHHGIMMNRIVAASFGILAVIAFFMIIRPWYSFRAAFLGTILFATSAGFLHTARLGTGQILQMSILAFIGAVLWYYRRKGNRTYVGYGVMALFALLWYVPGMLWFELFGLLLLRKGAWRQLTGMPRIHLAGWTTLFIAVLIPLGIASLHSPQLLLNAAGLPTTVHAFTHTGSNVLNAVMSIGVRSNGDPIFWVGHAPLLNVIELVLGLIGGYFYIYRERSVRSMFLVGSLTICLVLIGFGSTVSFACLVPLLYLFVTAGLNHFLGQWLRVFPRNPIARFTGVAIICMMLFFSVLYQVRSYFVAWPHTTAARKAFNHPRP
jgi:hypothetical protein